MQGKRFMLKKILSLFIFAALMTAIPGPARPEEPKSAPAAPQQQPQPQPAPVSEPFDQLMYSKIVGVVKDLKEKDFSAAKAGLKEMEDGCMDAGVTSCEPLSAAMIKQGKALLDAKEVGGAKLLFNSAARISPNYPPSYFAKGWAVLAEDKLKALTALDYFIEGFRMSIGDFWWTFFYAGNKATSILFTIAALFSLYGLFMALRYAPLLAHDLAETIKRPKAEDRLKYIALPLILLGILVFLGYWWAVSIAMLSLWVYFNKRERAAAISFFVLLIFMPEIMSNYSTFTQAGGDRLLWVMDEVNKGEVRGGSEGYLREYIKANPKDEQAMTALAQLYKKRGDYPQSAEVYEALERINPSEELYRNNLGNVYFLMGRPEDAVKEYKAAAASDPKKALPFFNMSQVYGESLMFTERERADTTARELDPGVVAQLRDRAGQTPIRMVFDEAVPVNTFWRLAFGEKSRDGMLADSFWNTSMRLLPLDGTRLAGICFIVLAFAVSAMRKKGVFSHYCRKCGRVSCRKCQKPFYNKELCPECHQIFVKLDGVEARDRVKKMLEVRETQRVNSLMCRVYSLILPGSGHFLAGHPIRGFLYMGLFIFFLKDIFFGNFFGIPYNFKLPIIQPDVLLMSLALVLVYVVAQLDSNRITIR